MSDPIGTSILAETLSGQNRVVQNNDSIIMNNHSLSHNVHLPHKYPHRPPTKKSLIVHPQ